MKTQQSKKLKGGGQMKKSIFQVGKNYLIRTVTMIYTGEFVGIEGDYILIKNAAWIPETARWMDTVASGMFNEVEPYPDTAIVGINRQASLDVVEVDWKLPRDQK